MFYLLSALVSPFYLWLLQGWRLQIEDLGGRLLFGLVAAVQAARSRPQWLEPWAAVFPAEGILSRGSYRSILSLGSVGSILSIGSVGSILSIGSVGSILSVGSLGSVLSVLSVHSALSFLSMGSRLSFLRYRAIQNNTERL